VCELVNPGIDRAGGEQVRLIASAVTGRWSRWVVIAIWVLAVAALVPLSGKLAGVEQNSQASFVPSGAASTRVTELQSRIPGSNDLPALVVLYRSRGLTASDLRLAAEDRARIAALHLPGVTQVGGEVRAPHGSGLFFPVTIAGSVAATTVGSDLTAMRHALVTPAPGLEQGIGGPAAILADTANAFSGIDGTLLLATVAIVALLLLLTYRSLFMWLFPLVAVGLASVVGQAGVYLIARAGFVVNGMTVGILTVLMFGAGTDYALLLVARYREELHTDARPPEAMARALARVAPTLVVSASTVILSLLVLLLARERDISALGPVGAIGIAAVLLASLTLLPALLSIFGRGAFWPLVPRPQPGRQSGRWSWGNVAGWVDRHRAMVWGPALLGLVILAAGLFTYPGSLPQADSFSGQPASTKAQELLSKSFPAGETGPVVVAVLDPAKVARARLTASSLPGVIQVGPSVQGRGVTIFDATLAYAPGGRRAEAVVKSLRRRESAAVGADVLVGGPTGAQIDLDQAASRDRLVVIPVVLAIVLLMLVLLLRSLLAPVLLVASVVVSFMASLGLATVCFRFLFHFAGVDSSVILLGFVFLVALGVDYNVFLVSRARQESGRGTRAGMTVALAATGGVITSAGVVLAATFTVLAVLPLVALTEIGFLVALGVLLDTFVVRTLVVPALVGTLGDRFWWPARVRSTPERS